MLFGQVQAFLEVARTGNVSRAAEGLYVTQPALTARIQALEKELGEALFVRTGRGVRLTDAGRVFLPCAEPISSGCGSRERLLAFWQDLSKTPEVLNPQTTLRQWLAICEVFTQD